MKTPTNEIVVAGKETLSEGKEYEVRNERKGTFKMRVTKIDGEWITGTITEGAAKAVMRYNVRDVGEEVTVRACHSYFISVGNAQTNCRRGWRLSREVTCETFQARS